MEQHKESGTKKDLVLYRIENAKSDVNSAKILLDAKEYKSANNRAYYGIYHAKPKPTCYAGGVIWLYKKSPFRYNRVVQALLQKD